MNARFERYSNKGTKNVKTLGIRALLHIEYNISGLRRGLWLVWVPGRLQQLHLEVVGGCLQPEVSDMKCEIFPL